LNKADVDGYDRQRIDKWLWFARLAKTRTLAQKLAVSGCVRVNRQKIGNAARKLRIGDVLTISTESGVRVLKVAATGSRRGPAPEARLLYEDMSPPAPPPETGSAGRESSGKRPTKRERRAIDRLKDIFPATGEDFLRGDD
jgi:ribosome-associated heat shock protein Hsp15